eukprot:1148480-Pelagomonas_calceolata.AAC.4
MMHTLRPTHAGKALHLSALHLSALPISQILGLLANPLEPLVRQSQSAFTGRVKLNKPRLGSQPGLGPWPQGQCLLPTPLLTRGVATAKHRAQVTLP